jgi:hypothetical protein
LGKIKDDLFDRAAEHRGDLALEIGRGGRIKAADELYGCGGRICGANAFLDLDF